MKYSNGTITTFAGNGVGAFGGDGGPVSSSSVNTPWKVIISPGGDIYFSDTNNHRIRKVFTNGTITTIAGTGIANYNGDNIPATSATLSSPRGLALTAIGELLIADSSNHRIRKIFTNGTMTTIAGTGTGALGGDGGLATNTTLYSPYAVGVTSFQQWNYNNNSRNWSFGLQW